MGNDYVVIEPKNISQVLTYEQIKRICHRNYGIGSDGILYGPLDTEKADFALKIFNPDGSEAEKSGNGLRIFARFLLDTQRIGFDECTIMTLGGIVKAQVLDNGLRVRVDMGQVSFDSTNIPIQGPPREVLSENIDIDGKAIEYSAATIGNPHCVVLNTDPSEALARELGPKIETDARFSNRTNVQFLKVLDRNNIQIEIWERGAGYTLASGSSSSAAAAVAYKLGLCDSQIQVHMPGGQIDIEIAKDFYITMTGSVTRVAEGVLSSEMFD